MLSKQQWFCFSRSNFHLPNFDQTHSFVQPEPIRVVIPSTVIAGRYKLLERIGEGGQRLGGDVDGTGLTVLTVMTLLTFIESQLGCPCELIGNVGITDRGLVPLQSG